MQWSTKARELMRNQCIEWSIELEEEIYKTFRETNKKRQKYNLEPKKRITKDIVKETILKIINDTPNGGENQEIKDLVTEVMYQ